MSVHDIKTRCADVAGIQSLSMKIEAGKLSFQWGDGYAAAVDVTASDADCETAIRNAARLPALSLIPDKPAIVAQPATQGTAMSTTPGSAASVVQEMMAEHVRLTRDIHAASLAALQTSLARQRDAMSGAVGNVAAKIDSQTDDFLSIMGQFTNAL